MSRMYPVEKLKLVTHSLIAGLLLCTLGAAASTDGNVTPAPSNAPLLSPRHSPGLIDAKLSDQQFFQLCSAQRQFNFFQRNCIARQTRNTQEIADAWIVFQARNRVALATVKQVCQSSRRWSALQQRLSQEEQRAALQWQQKTPEQVESVCETVPRALRDTALENELRKFSDQVKTQ